MEWKSWNRFNSQMKERNSLFLHPFFYSNFFPSSILYPLFFSLFVFSAIKSYYSKLNIPSLYSAREAKIVRRILLIILNLIENSIPTFFLQDSHSHSTFSIGFSHCVFPILWVHSFLQKSILSLCRK